jgi:hypothetical protein
MTKPYWLTPELIKAAESVELDYFQDHEDLPRGVLKVTLPAEDREQQFVFRFIPTLSTGCHVKIDVELNGETVGANLDAEESRALYVAAEQRKYDDQNQNRNEVDARRSELLGAAEKVFRARLAGKGKGRTRTK